MTDRLKGVIVTFDTDIREDDARQIIKAIKMIKGVLRVEKSVTNIDDHMNRARIGALFEQEILDTLQRLREGKIGSGH